MLIEDYIFITIGLLNCILTEVALRTLLMMVDTMESRTESGVGI